MRPFYLFSLARSLACFQLLDARGVRQVLDVLTTSRKAVIAHHSMLDLLHVYDAFVGDTATLTLARFRQRLPKHLPLLFDTKVCVLEKTTNRLFAFDHKLSSF